MAVLCKNIIINTVRLRKYSSQHQTGRAFRVNVKKQLISSGVDSMQVQQQVQRHSEHINASLFHVLHLVSNIRNQKCSSVLNLPSFWFLNQADVTGR